MLGENQAPVEGASGGGAMVLTATMQRKEALLAAVRKAGTLEAAIVLVVAQEAEAHPGVVGILRGMRWLAQRLTGGVGQTTPKELLMWLSGAPVEEKQRSTTAATSAKAVTDATVIVTVGMGATALVDKLRVWLTAAMALVRDHRRDPATLEAPLLSLKTMELGLTGFVNCMRGAHPWLVDWLEGVVKVDAPGAEMDYPGVGAVPVSKGTRVMGLIIWVAAVVTHGEPLGRAGAHVLTELKRLWGAKAAELGGCLPLGRKGLHATLEALAQVAQKMAGDGYLLDNLWPKLKEAQWAMVDPYLVVPLEQRVEARLVRARVAPSYEATPFLERAAQSGAASLGDLSLEQLARVCVEAVDWTAQEARVNPQLAIDFPQAAKEVGGE